jgi:hypothetical protein
VAAATGVTVKLPPAPLIGSAPSRDARGPIVRHFYESEKRATSLATEAGLRLLVVVDEEEAGEVVRALRRG